MEIKRSLGTQKPTRLSDDRRKFPWKKFPTLGEISPDDKIRYLGSHN